MTQRKRATLYGGGFISELIHPGYLTLSALNSEILHIAKAAPYATTLCLIQRETYHRDALEGFNYRLCGTCYEELRKVRMAEAVQP
jgi:hypothetical protein